MIGGCCGTTPIYIEELIATIKGIPRRQVPGPNPKMMLSGMTEFIHGDHIPFINVGERCNISGSLKFKRLIKSDDWESAVAIAKE
jgi:5-methyltetrahydrofolate--homocysteine methyltransferase